MFHLISSNWLLITYAVINFSSNTLAQQCIRSHIYLKENQLRCIMYSQFPDLKTSGTDIARFVLLRSDINELPKDTFDSTFSALRELDLSRNGITNVEAGAFDNLIFLEDVQLQNNSIKRISKHIFANNFNLKYVDLSNNDLKSIDISIVKKLTKLTTFLLDGNNFELSETEYLNYFIDNNIKICGNDNTLCDHLLTMRNLNGGGRKTKVVTIENGVNNNDITKYIIISGLIFGTFVISLLFIILCIHLKVMKNNKTTVEPFYREIVIKPESNAPLLTSYCNGAGVRDSTVSHNNDFYVDGYLRPTTPMRHPQYTQVLGDVAHTYFSNSSVPVHTTANSLYRTNRERNEHLYEKIHYKRNILQAGEDRFSSSLNENNFK